MTVGHSAKLVMTPAVNPWQWGEYDARVRECARLRLAVRRLLAFEWSRAALADAKRVLPLFERVFPDDRRPREAIEAAELLIDRPDLDAAAAAGAAGAAAGAAAGFSGDSIAADVTTVKSRCGPRGTRYHDLVFRVVAHPNAAPGGRGKWGSSASSRVG